MNRTAVYYAPEQEIITWEYEPSPEQLAYEVIKSYLSDGIDQTYYNSPIDRWDQSSISMRTEVLNQFEIMDDFFNQKVFDEFKQVHGSRRLYEMDSNGKLDETTHTHSDPDELDKARFVANSKGPY